MKTILFACVHNAGRSQMAAAFFNALADPTKAHAISAGTEPGARVHPEVVAAMREVGVDLTGASPTKLTDALATQAELLVTMGCGEGVVERWTSPRPRAARPGDRAISPVRHALDWGILLMGGAAMEDTPIPGYRFLVTNPDRFGGKPTVGGTRFTVSFILACLAEGMSYDDIVHDYSELPRESIPEILRFAAALTDRRDVAA